MDVNDDIISFESNDGNTDNRKTTLEHSDEASQAYRRWKATQWNEVTPSSLIRDIVTDLREVSRELATHDIKSIVTKNRRLRSLGVVCIAIACVSYITS
jgi:hypothetical protein